MEFLKKLFFLNMALLLFSFGIVFTIQCGLGASPWDVFHLGLTNYTELSLGQISQIVGLILIVVSYLLGQSPGLSTFFNMYVIGVFLDLIMNSKFLPVPEHIISQFIMLFLGIYFLGWASYFYLEIGWGSGPRDGLMLGLMQKTGKPVWIIRLLLEGSVLIIGYFLGGQVGIGTLMTAIFIGFSIEHAYKVMKRNPAETKHVTIKQGLFLINSRLKIKQETKL